MILEFLKELTEAGYRIFSGADAKEVAEGMGLKSSSISYILRSLASQKLIRPLYKRTYAIADNILTGPPLHPFEIAMHLVKEGAISCWTAMSYHELTDQVLSRVYVLAPYVGEKRRSLYRYKIEGCEYHIIQIKKEHFWGFKKQFIDGEIKINITDLERTIIDGLIRPQYCGGFREVLNAFELANDRLDISKLFNYGKRCSIAVQKRLGWILSHYSIDDLEDRIALPSTDYFDKLDPLGPRRGKYNKPWMILENI